MKKPKEVNGHLIVNNSAGKEECLNCRRKDAQLRIRCDVRSKVSYSDLVA